MKTLRPADFLQPELLALHRLPMRAPSPFFANADDAVADKRPRRRRSLDGEWDFALVDSPEQIPAAWPGAVSGTRNSGGATHRTQVPGLWTMDPAVDDWPHYTNIIMPWPGLEAPETPERNPVGLYSRTFDVPKAWLRDDLVLHLGGFESVAAVWCNGRFVGMGKDSRLASEFLLNDMAVAGENRLDVMVIRYSDATWIEDQDHWWHGGLHRSVMIEARPRHRVDDLAIVADFDPATGRGLLHVDAHVCGRAAGTVRVTVFDEGDVVASGDGTVPSVPSGPPLQQLVDCYVYPGRVASINLEADQVRPWTAETPHRYLVVAELLDDAGRVRMATSTKVGFRRVEMRDRRFLVNGEPIVFHGVNRHDHHPDTGKVQTVDDLRDDLLTMRAHNINAVRCAHYPNDPALLDLCDELGFWVIDEANIECHARLRSVADDPRYLPAMLDRVSRMVMRDRNHPSVVMWSLGNESGHGVAHDAAAAWVRATDSSRPLHYEGAVQRRFLVETADPTAACVAPSARERAVTDVVCPMYTAVEVVEAWAEWAESTELDDRPLVLCEFSHAMGNSNGGFDRYAEAFHRFDALAGGFVWDWRDQGLRVNDGEGVEYWAYGGHFGDEPNDANFCMNGVVGSDGLPHPGLTEIAWGYQPVRVTHRRGRTVAVQNRRSFIGLDDLDATWKLVVDGSVVEVGSLSVDPAPGSIALAAVPYTATLPRRGDVQLRFEWHASDDGRLVAVDEVVLREPTATTNDDLAVLAVPGLSSVRPTDSSSPVRIGETTIEWDDTGPSRLVVGGRLITDDGLTPWLWRAPVDNDGVAQGWMSDVAGVRPRWLSQGLDHLGWKVEGMHVSMSDDTALLIFDRVPTTGGNVARWCTRLVATADALIIDEAVQLGDEWTDLPRIGTRFIAPPDLTSARWFGRGPHESYADRKASAGTGIWTRSIADHYHPYAVPQEHGAHADPRWFELLDDSGAGLRFELTNVASFSARYHDDHMLTAAETIADITPIDGVDVHIDVGQRGIGTGACGPDTAPAYRLAAGEHRWRFAITEVRP